MDSPNQPLEELSRLSRLLTEGPKADLNQVLADRRRALTQLAEQPAAAGEPAIEAALDAGRDGRTRLVVELASLRAQIQELQQVRTGLSQMQPADKHPPALDVRL